MTVQPQPFYPTGFKPSPLVNIPDSATVTTEGFAQPQGMMSIPEMADTASSVIKNVMRVEPMIAGMAGMFVPGLSMVQPWIVMVAPYLERALDEIAKNNNGDVLGAFLDLIQHLTPGQPDAPALLASAPDAPAANDMSNSSSASRSGGLPPPPPRAG